MLTLLNLESDLHQLIFYNFAGSLQTTSSAWLDTLVIAAMSKCLWIISKSWAPCRWSEVSCSSAHGKTLYVRLYFISNSSESAVYRRNSADQQLVVVYDMYCILRQNRKYLVNTPLPTWTIEISPRDMCVSL